MNDLISDTLDNLGSFPAHAPEFNASRDEYSDPQRTKLYFLIRQDINPGEAATYVAHAITNLFTATSIQHYSLWEEGGYQKILLTSPHSDYSDAIVKEAEHEGIRVTAVGRSSKVYAFGPVDDRTMMAILKKQGRTILYH